MDEWNEGTGNEKCSTCLQDKSTTLKLIPMLQPKQLSLFSSNLLLKLNTLFFFFLFFSFLFSISIFFFLRNFIPSFYFWFFFFSLNKYNTKIMHPHTCLLVGYQTNPKQKDTRSHYHRLANTTKQWWDGVGEQKKWLMSDRLKGLFLKFVFRWMVIILAMVLN